jgi:hypothetical protein
MSASICCAEAEVDTQFTILALSALKKQCLIFKYGYHRERCLLSTLILILVDIILQIKKEESCYLSISICNPPLPMLRKSEKEKALVL